MPATTRKANANAHPGAIVAKVTSNRRPRGAVVAEKAEKLKKTNEKLAQDKADQAEITQLEERMAKEDAGADESILPHNRPQRKAALHSIRTANNIEESRDDGVSSDSGEDFRLSDLTTEDDGEVADGDDEEDDDDGKRKAKGKEKKAMMARGALKKPIQVGGGRQVDEGKKKDRVALDHAASASIRDGTRKQTDKSVLPPYPDAQSHSTLTIEISRSLVPSLARMQWSLTGLSY